MRERKQYYGIIGNGETCALISPTGSIDWLCMPTFDRKIVFGRALADGEDSLYLEVYDSSEALVPKKTRQKYLEKTNILVTTIDYRGIRLEITDFMPWKGITESIRDKRVLYRLITVKNKTSRNKKIRIAVSTQREGELEQKKTYSNSHYSYAIHRDNLDFSLRPRATSGRFLFLAYGRSRNDVKQLLSKLKKIRVQDELEKAERFWKNWIARGKNVTFRNREHEDMFYRSLLLCKLLTYQPTGAILAAPTASFPATPGGTENWDYRFCWVRDSYFVSRAFLKTGHYDEVRELLEFLYRIQGRDGGWLPLYTIDGKKLGKEIEIETSQDTIRIGNAAREQFQLDAEGSVLHATYLYYLFTKDREFLRANWKKIKKAAEWIRRNYKKKENGIWELREKEHKKRMHWTYGKVLCYVGLESALRIAEILKKEVSEKWGTSKELLKEEILQEAWSPQRRAFVQAYDDDTQADISVLSIEDYGLLSPFHPKIKSTVALMEEKLVTRGYGIKRFEDGVLPFYLPTLWMVMHFLRAGDRKKAEVYLNACLGSMTDLHLMAEHFDPLSGTQFGNFPQAFNHSILIEVLLTMKERNKSIKLLGILEKQRKVISDIINEIKPKHALYFEDEE